MMCFRNGHTSCARVLESVVKTRLPLALLLTSQIEPGQVVGRRRVRMLLTMLMHRVGVRGASWSCRITTSCLVRMSVGADPVAAREGRLRWFRFRREMTG